MKLIMFSFSEPFLEAVPQVMVMLCIAFLSGFNEQGRFYSYECAPQNCGIVSLIPWVDPWFFGTFCLSVFSASFGMTRFLKVGPMTLVPRNSYGLSFFVALFLVAIAIVSKAAALAFLLATISDGPTRHLLSNVYIVRIAVWLGICVLPSFFYVSTQYIVHINNFAMHTYLCSTSKVVIVLEQRQVALLSSIKICENLNFSGCAVEKFKFSQILMDDKSATSLCSKNVSTL